MKKVLFFISIISVFIACKSGDEKQNVEDKTKIVDITEIPDYQKGLELTSKSDCFTCHKIDEKNIGPAWRDVANKYANTDDAEEILAKKIIEGGSGNWGEIPMASHANFSEEEAKTIVRYILLMKE